VCRTMELSKRYNSASVGRRPRTFLVFLAALAMGLQVAPAWAETDSDREYKVKAAFVLNFIKFIDGGRLDLANDDAKAPILVGVVGRLPSVEAFEELAGKEVKGRTIVVRRFQGFEEARDRDGQTPERHPDMDEIRKCHVLFLCPSEKAYLGRILPAVQADGILTVGDVEGFAEAGGVINFVIVDKKVRFEINRAAAARAKLQIRSSLLRLAIRTIEDDELEK
jgi:hypothetical protein